MSAVVGEAAENREERTTTALTAGVHLTAAVAGTGVGRQPIAMSGRSEIGEPPTEVDPWRTSTERLGSLPRL
jgi:hypothetical protein